MFNKYYILTFKDDTGRIIQKSTDHMCTTISIYNMSNFVLINSLEISKKEYKKIGEGMTAIKGSNNV